MPTLPPPDPTRRGVATPWFLVTGMVLVLLAVWAVSHAGLRHAQLELHNAAEASALATANALVDDRLLTADPARQATVEQQARAAAQRYGLFNRVMTHPLDLDPNPDNRTGGELVLGTLSDPFSRAFDATHVGQPELYRPNRNAVRVAVKRSRVAASATAFVDRDVIGFKVQGAMSLTPGGPPGIPVMPLALLTDPDPDSPKESDAKKRQARWAGRHRDSWEYRILARKGLHDDGSDDYQIAPAPPGTPPQVLPGSDGIPEMRVTIRAGGGPEASGRLALVGVSAPADVCGQFLTGITAAQLRDRRGRLLLDDGLGTSTPQNYRMLPCLAGSSLGRDDLASLRSALGQIVGRPRVWMLYVRNPKAAPSANALQVLGFVGARLVAVEPDRGDGTLSAVLQPCMLVTATAVTDCRRRDLGPRTLFNPYVCKVRLVE